MTEKKEPTTTTQGEVPPTGPASLDYERSKLPKTVEPKAETKTKDQRKSR